MSGSILSEFDGAPHCGEGKFARRTTGGGWECVEYNHLVPIDLVVQGDCDGFLAVRLTYVEAINPPETESRGQAGRPVKLGPEVALDGLPLSIGMRELKSRLDQALRGVVSPRRARTAQATPRSGIRGKAKGKGKATVTRSRKTARKKK